MIVSGQNKWRLYVDRSYGWLSDSSQIKVQLHIMHFFTRFFPTRNYIGKNELDIVLFVFMFQIASIMLETIRGAALAICPDRSQFLSKLAKWFWTWKTVIHGKTY